MSLHLGNFLGPTISGFLVEAVGFRSTTTVFFVLFILIVIVDLAEFFYNFKFNRTRKSAEYEEISAKSTFV